MKKLLPILLTLLLVPGISLAQQSGSYASSSAGTSQLRPTPDAVLRNGINDLQTFLKSDQSDNQEALIGLIRARIAPQFDIYALARWSGGYWYGQMNPEQRKAFTIKLAKSFFSSLADIVGGYAGNMPEVRFMPPRRIDQNEVDVTARVFPANNYPIDVRFSFHRTPRGWLIFDVSTNGVSAVNYYRKMFNARARQGGLGALY
ncbi:MAG TPA: ABC transporter substrate-binding protein [Gammaproteobacteria bacterium]|nr:ABC transporter substrate-binding protein [Gammaproteobacteria bacterium]